MLSYRSVASGLSPFAEMERSGSSCSTLHCSKPVDSNAWAEAIEEGFLEGVAKQQPNLEEKPAEVERSCASSDPGFPRRGRQLQGEPSPSDYQDVLAQESPFRRNREGLPRFGSGTSKLQAALLRSLYEEEAAVILSGADTRSPSSSSSTAGRERRSLRQSGSRSKETVTPPPTSYVYNTPNAASASPAASQPMDAAGTIRASPVLARRGSPAERGHARGAEPEQPNPSPLAGDNCDLRGAGGRDAVPLRPQQ